MTVMDGLTDNVDGVISHNDTVWQDVLTITGTIDQLAKYLIDAGLEMAGSVTNRAIAGRVTIDGVERRKHRFVPDEADEYQDVSFHSGKIQLDTGSHTLKIQTASGHSSQTVSSRRHSVVLIKY